MAEGQPACILIPVQTNQYGGPWPKEVIKVARTLDYLEAGNTLHGTSDGELGDVDMWAVHRALGILEEKGVVKMEFNSKWVVTPVPGIDWYWTTRAETEEEARERIRTISDWGSDS